MKKIALSQLRSSWLRLIFLLVLAISTTVIVVLNQLPSNATLTNYPKVISDGVSNSGSVALPLQQPHPLPAKLAAWQDPQNTGDYFAEVKPTQVGYLIWSQFPIKVYIQNQETNNNTQMQEWFKNVLQAAKEWNIYLPLVVIEEPENADITIMRSAPPLQTLPNSKITRARSAETRYKFYTSNNLLLHRCTILLSPSQTGKYLQAAARHELGHALGIWGHSLIATDALYFSQVRNPVQISSRDINTLKQVYKQPTSLGWSLQ